MEQYFLLSLAVIPPILFMLFIYWMDRHEPESIKNVLIALVLGGISTVPAIIVEIVFGDFILFTQGGMTGSFFESFLLVAPTEEFFKFIVIFLFLRRKEFYDEINDGIVYYGAGAIGFALVENISYVLENGVGTGLLRAFTAIPLHTFCGVIVGYHAGLASFGGKKRPGFIMFRGIFIAIFIHASYNTLASLESFLSLLFFPLVLLLYAIGLLVLSKGRKLSLSTGPISFESTKKNKTQMEGLVDEFGRRYLKPKREIWKAVIARAIFITCALLWVIVFIPGGDEMDVSFLDLAFGTFILTFIPISIGLILEISYRRRKNKKIYIP